MKGSRQCPTQRSLQSNHKRKSRFSFCPRTKFIAWAPEGGARCQKKNKQNSYTPTHRYLKGIYRGADLHEMGKS